MPEPGVGRIVLKLFLSKQKINILLFDFFSLRPCPSPYITGFISSYFCQIGFVHLLIYRSFQKQFEFVLCIAIFVVYFFFKVLYYRAPDRIHSESSSQRQPGSALPRGRGLQRDFLSPRAEFHR